MTTCPLFAPPSKPGSTRMSWLIRLFSATTNSTPRSENNRPTSLVFLRSSTSTIEPSRRPRRSTPTSRTIARSPSSTLCICFGPKKRSSEPLSGTRKPKPSGCPCTRPGIRSSFSTRQISPCRLRITCASRSIAARRRVKPSISSSPMSSMVASCSMFIGTPVLASTSRINSRLGNGFSYLACSRALWGSAARGDWCVLLFFLVKMAFKISCWAMTL